MVSCSIRYIISLTLWLSHFLVILTFWCFLAYGITISEIFPRDRKSYLTHAPRGTGGTLIFSFIRRLVFFFVFFFYLGGGGGGGQKNEKKMGSDDFVDIFWVITNWTIFRGHFYAFKDLFLRLRYRMGDIFWGC